MEHMPNVECEWKNQRFGSGIDDSEYIMSMTKKSQFGFLDGSSHSFNVEQKLGTTMGDREVLEEDLSITVKACEGCDSCCCSQSEDVLSERSEETGSYFTTEYVEKCKTIYITSHSLVIRKKPYHLKLSLRVIRSSLHG